MRTVFGKPIMSKEVSRLTIATILGLATLLYFYLIDQMQGRFRSAHYGLTILVSYLAAASIAVIDSHAKRRNRRIEFGRSGECVLVAVTSLAIFMFVDKFGMKQFGGSDLSITIDLGKRMLEGYRPYIDFYCNFPPLYFLPIHHAFRFFGMNWQAIVWMCAIFGVLTFVWHYAMLRASDFSIFESYFASVSTQVAATLMTSYWWYNGITSLAGLSLAISAIFWMKKPNSRFAIASFVLSTIMLFYGKANFWPLLPGIYGIVLTSRSHFRGLVLAVILSSIGIFGVSLMNGFSLQDFWYGTVSIASSRGFPNPVKTVFNAGYTIPQILYYISMLEFFSFVLIRRIVLDIRETTSFENWTDRLRVDAIVLCSCVVAFLVFSTNIEPKEVDLVCMVTPVFLLEALRKPLNDKLSDGDSPAQVMKPVRESLVSSHRASRFPGRRDSEYGLVTFVVLATSISTLSFSSGRLRVLAIGPYFEYPIARIGNENRFFESVEVGNTFRQMLAEIDEVLRANPGKSVFFGFRLEFAYAAFGVPSPSHLPIYWYPGTSYPLDIGPAEARKWIDQNYDLIILFDENAYWRIPGQILYGRSYVNKNFRSPDKISVNPTPSLRFYPVEMIDWIERNYEFDYSRSETLIIAYRKAKATSP